MIYNSPELIPAKLYFKILESGNFELLSDDKDCPEEELKKAWKKLEEDYSYSNKSTSKELKKVIDISKKIESYSSQIQFVNLAVYHLRHLKDEELIEKLKSYNYTFKWQKVEVDTEITEAIFQNDLDQIERSVEALDLKIKIEQRKLPKPTESSTDELPFDETVLMYAAFTGLGYVNPNIIPLTQYDAMIVNGNKKMKALEANNNK